MSEIDRAELQSLLDVGGSFPQLTGWDLRGLDLREMDLRGVNFEGSTLENADLRGVDLTGANLKDVNLSGARLEKAILPASHSLDGLSGEYRLRLEKAEIFHRIAVEEVLAEGEDAFLGIPGVGPATLQAVKEWLVEGQ